MNKVVPFSFNGNFEGEMDSRSAAFSESFHGPIIVRQQSTGIESKSGNRQKPEASVSSQTSGEAASRRKRSHDEKGLSVCSQIFLTSAVIGVELMATFAQLFEILILQFLGVPTNLVSIAGVITGFISVVLIPTLGWFSNRGSNSLKLKMLLMSLVLFNLVVGFAILAVCGYLKILSLNDALQKLENYDALIDGHANSSIVYLPSNSWNTSEFNTIVLTGLNHSEAYGATTLPTEDVPHRAALAIIAFALMGIGFDAGLFLSRSFILTCAPPFQHTRILVMASIMQSVTGTVFALVNTLDISEFWGHIFGVNGIAATVMFYSVFLAIVEILTFGCTMLTGFLIAKRNQKSCYSDPNAKTQPSFKNQDNSNGHLVSPELRNGSWRLSSIHSETKSKKQTIDGRTPLIHKENDPSDNYSAITYTLKSDNLVKGSSKERATFNEAIGIGRDMKRRGNPCFSDALYPFPIDSEEVHGYEMPKQCSLEKSKNTMTSLHDTPSSEPDYDKENHIKTWVITCKDAMRSSLSFSKSSEILTLSEDKRIGSKLRLHTGNNKTTIFSKKLLILYLSAFLVNGAMCTVIIYESNILTIGIYHGDPHALPGTKGYVLYQKGLQTAAWGIVTLYIAFAAGSLFTRRLVDLIGEIPQYTLTNLLFLVSNIALLLMKTREMYFVIMATAGFQRVCVYVLNYAIALKFVREQELKDGLQHSSGNVDKVTSLIGLSLPLHFAMLSVVLGPVMAATGSVWIPTVHSVIVISATLLISSLFYIVK